MHPDRSLLEVAPETMRGDPHSIAAGLFQHHNSPQFGFRRGEQELMELALDGADDAGIAMSLFVTLPAIKRRWSNIFARVASIRPDLCPLDGEGTRGIQRRQRILAWVRSHPEELRPFNQRDEGSGAGSPASAGNRQSAAELVGFSAERVAGAAAWMPGPVASSGPRFTSDPSAVVQPGSAWLP